MILVTCGSQLPFDRLVRTVDEWAVERQRSDVLAQIGSTNWVPDQVKWVRLLEPAEFRARLKEAQVIVSHAGMGTILSALEAGKPILVMPRRADLQETRNDHQFATARALQEQGKVAVALDERELKQKLDGLGALHAAERIGLYASPELLDCLRSFVTSRGPRGHLR